MILPHTVEDELQVTTILAARRKKCFHARHFPGPAFVPERLYLMKQPGRQRRNRPGAQRSGQGDYLLPAISHISELAKWARRTIRIKKGAGGCPSAPCGFSVRSAAGNRSAGRSARARLRRRAAETTGPLRPAAADRHVGGARDLLATVRRRCSCRGARRCQTSRSSSLPKSDHPTAR